MYKLVRNDPIKVWLNTETGDSFVENEDIQAHKDFTKWLEDGGTPDETPIDTPTIEESRSERIKHLVTAGKQAIDAANLSTVEAKKLAAIFKQVLDGLAALDAPPDVPA